MVLAVLVSVALLVQAMRPAAMVPGRLQNEMMFEFVADMVRSNVGEAAISHSSFLYLSLFYSQICWALSLTATQ